MHKIPVLLLCFLLSLSSHAQTFVFKMFVFGDSAGVSVVSKVHQADGTDLYTLDSRIQAKILWITRTNHTHYEARYRDGKLISSTYSEINNGKKDKWNNITYDGRQYLIDSYQGKKTFSEVPPHSVGTLYCNGFDPSVKKFFYEPGGEIIDISYPEPNTLEFKSTDGNKNIFRFKNGQISEVEFHTTLATVYLKRVK